MLRALAIIVLLVAAPLAAAQSYSIMVRSGVGDVVAPPYTRLQVFISRNDNKTFVGRVVVEVNAAGMGGRRGRRGRRGPRIQSADVTVTQDVTLEEGAKNRMVSLVVPVSGIFSADVHLERRVTSDYYVEVASEQHSPGMLADPKRKLIGFVSPARLKVAQDYLFFQVAEIQIQDLPVSWKPLACFDAIVLNDDRLTRAQSAALVDYMAAGGTVILSPSSPGSFNPETPAGSLLQIPATTQQTFKKLSEFSTIFKGELHRSGFGGAGKSAPGEASKDETQPSPTQAELVKPDNDAMMRFWPDNGRSKPAPDTGGLVSVARVGAGNLVLLHTDISSEPFTVGDHVPTTAVVQLLGLAVKTLSARTDATPMNLLLDQDVRDSVDIAGRRIPGHNALVVILLLYVAIAGVGMFLVARKFRRPELYPATLLVAALVSVGLVFGLGEIYKRSGDRVKAVRILVSDETTSRNALFEMGSAYAVDGDSYDFVNSRKAALVPAHLDPRLPAPRGMPIDPLNYTTNFTAAEENTHVTGLDRWQNVFFAKREPGQLEGFKVEVTSMEKAWRVVNKSPHQLKACVFLVGSSDPPPGMNCEWHYVPMIGAAGTPDATVTFSDSTRLPNDPAEAVKQLADHVSEDADAFPREVLGAMFAVNPEDRLGMATSLAGIEGRLFKAGLQPEPGEFLLMAVLPEDALAGNSLGPQQDGGDVKPEDTGEVNLWMIRGGVEGR